MATSNNFTALAAFKAANKLASIKLSKFEKTGRLFFKFMDSDAVENTVIVSTTIDMAKPMFVSPHQDQDTKEYTPNVYVLSNGITVVETDITI